MSKRKLLLADDSVTIQKVVNLTFADEGIDVITVGDGDAAMEKIAEFTPDLVMADVNMPGLSGYEVCEKIRQNDATRQIPVILLVGSFEPFDEAEAERVGANDFLTKPFQSIRQLVNKVTDLLGKGAANGASEEAETVADETTPEAEAAEEDTFAETIEMSPEVRPGSELGDTGMDDEMIEASSADAYAKGDEVDYETEPVDDYARTQPLNEDDLREFDFSNQPAIQANDEERATTREEADIDQAPAPAAEDAGEIEYAPALDETEDIESLYRESVHPVAEESQNEELAEESYAAGTESAETAEPAAADARPQESEFPAPESVPFVGFDDDDLLELPPIAPDADFETQFGPQERSPEPQAEAAAEEAPVESFEPEPPPREEFAPQSFPPEVIEAIAQRVAEKISGQVLSEIAARVAPQISELIVQELARERSEG